jgi:hypothetical protein
MTLPGQEKVRLRMFSIMGGRTGRLAPIPFLVLISHETQAKINHGGQTLERLHARGGLDPYEALAVLNDHDCRGGEWQKLQRLSFDEAERELRRLVDARMELLRNMPPPPCTHPPRPEKVDDRGLMKCPQCGDLITPG